MVLKTRKRTSEFNSFCLIGITPVILRHDFVWEEVARRKFSIMEFVQNFRVFPGDTRTRRVTCLGWYDARPLAGLPTIGKVDASRVFEGPVTFRIGDGTSGRWPLCGRIDMYLGMEAVIAWRRIHDAAQLALDEEARRADLDEHLARVKQEERDKRAARKLKKA